RLQGDWSSDVCSSDLESIGRLLGPTAAADPVRSRSHASSRRRVIRRRDAAIALCTVLLIGCGASTFIWYGQVTSLVVGYALSARSEERRVGKGGGAGW